MGEFNARTTGVRPEVPIQVVLVPKTDRSYQFYLRTPQVQWFLQRVARIPKGSDWGAGKDPVGNVTLKEIPYRESKKYGPGVDRHTRSSYRYQHHGHSCGNGN